MKLTFRGNDYEIAFPVVETTETQEKLTFLGQPYARKQALVSKRHQSSSELTYRGVRYTR